MVFEVILQDKFINNGSDKNIFNVNIGAYFKARPEEL